MLSPRPLFSAAFVARARAVAAANASDCAALADRCDAFLAAPSVTARMAVAHEIAATLPKTLRHPLADDFRAVYRDGEDAEALRFAVRALRAELARRAGKAVA